MRAVTAPPGRGPAAPGPAPFLLQPPGGGPGPRRAPGGRDRSPLLGGAEPPGAGGVLKGPSPSWLPLTLLPLILSHIPKSFSELHLVFWVKWNSLVTFFFSFFFIFKVSEKLSLMPECIASWCCWPPRSWCRQSDNAQEIQERVTLGSSRCLLLNAGLHHINPGSVSCQWPLRHDFHFGKQHRNSEKAQLGNKVGEPRFTFLQCFPPKALRAP